jgi:uncharacterized delta-60 repeat protein
MGTLESLEHRRLLAAPAIDLTFGRGGLANVTNIWGDAFVVHQLGNGKIVMAGGGQFLEGGNGSFSDDPYVARFNADGSLDTSFDSDGILTLPQSDGVVSVADGALAPDGKIYLLNNSFQDASPDQNEVRIFRFNADGTIDSSFGVNGIVKLAGATLNARKISVQGDGKLLITYVGQAGPNQTLLISRLNTDGTVDNSYRGGFPSSQDTGLHGVDYSLIGPDGKVYLATAGDSFDTVVARFNTDGTIDTTFGGGDGIAETGNATDMKPRFNHMAIDSSGRIIIASQASTATYQTLLVTRLTSTGAKDTTFASNGVLDFGPDAYNTPVPSDVLIDSNGKIVVANGESLNNFELIRLNTNGTLDTTFGENGIFRSGRFTYRPERMVFDNAGNFLIGGQGVGDFSNTTQGLSRVLPSKADVFLDHGNLYVNGTNAADSISFSHTGSNLVVHRNGADTSITFASVSGIAVYTNGGDDVVSIPFAINSTVNGGEGNDTVTTGDGNLTFDGERGNDKITAGNGNHEIRTHSGPDTITTGVGNDFIDAGIDPDIVTTGDEADYILGDSLNDPNNAGSGNDNITTGSGDDTILTGFGTDTVHAGGGNDFIAGLLSNPDLSRPDRGALGLSAKKEYYGQDGDDTIIGGKSADFIEGGNGNDFLEGGGYVDEINGNAGNDVIYGGYAGRVIHKDADGADSILAGEGDDWIDAEDSSTFAGGNTVFGGNGNDKVFSGAGPDSLWGEDGNDKLYGSDGSDSLYGNGGSDTLYGGAQSDHLRGTGGRDKIYGGGGNDRLYGGASADFLYGQAGFDQILGEGGNDRLYGDDGDADTLSGGAGNDFFITVDGVADHLFGDGGRDSMTGDDSDVRTSIEVRT